MTELNLTLEHIEKGYTRPVLTDVELTADNSSYISIIGKSGSGKSTLMNILGLIEGFDKGSYRFNGTTIRNGWDYARLRAENIGFIFQSYHLIPTLSCRENILLPAMYYHKKTPDYYDELVSMLEIGPLLSQRVNTLSGGEKQRVAIARALTLDPCLLLADEPTGNLDTANGENILSILTDLAHREGYCVVVVTHDETIGQRADKLLRLQDGLAIQ